MYVIAGGQTELDFARALSRVTRKSIYILQHLAIMEVDESYASILYPVAQGDLQALLDGRLDCKDWSRNATSSQTDCNTYTKT